MIREARPEPPPAKPITPRAALAIAEAKVPGARLRSARIDSEHGRPVYAYVFASEGRRGVDEVRVDALSAEPRVLHQAPGRRSRGRASPR